MAHYDHYGTAKLIPRALVLPVALGDVFWINAGVNDTVASLFKKRGFVFGYHKSASCLISKVLIKLINRIINSHRLISMIGGSDAKSW